MDLAWSTGHSPIETESVFPKHSKWEEPGKVQKLVELWGFTDHLIGSKKPGPAGLGEIFPNDRLIKLLCILSSLMSEWTLNVLPSHTPFKSSQQQINNNSLGKKVSSISTFMSWSKVKVVVRGMTDKQGDMMDNRVHFTLVHFSACYKMLVKMAKLFKPVAPNAGKWFALPVRWQHLWA